jgi:hypothetical protein
MDRFGGTELMTENTAVPMLEDCFDRLLDRRSK